MGEREGQCPCACMYTCVKLCVCSLRVNDIPVYTRERESGEETVRVYRESSVFDGENGKFNW